MDNTGRPNDDFSWARVSVRAMLVKILFNLAREFELAAYGLRR